MTKVRQNQTQHLTAPHVSEVRFLRRLLSRLSGGGLLSWSVSGGLGTFSWDQDLYIENPLNYLTLRITAGSIASVSGGECIYVVMPPLTGEDTKTGLSGQVAGTTYDASLAKGAAEYNDERLVIGFHVNETGVLHLIDGTTIGDGQITALGGRVGEVDRVIALYASPTVTLPFEYELDSRQLAVWVNGKLQVPGSDNAPVDGYQAAVDADYVEATSGAPPSGFGDQITFQAGSLPSTGDVVVAVNLAGAQGPPGQPGFGGLDNAYNTQANIPLVAAAEIQTPIDLEEADPGWSGDVYPTNARPEALRVLRGASHPTAGLQGESAFIIYSSGHQAGSGLLLFHGVDGATLESALAGDTPSNDVGLWALMPGIGLGATDPENKIGLTFLEQGQNAPATIKEVIDLLQSNDFQLAINRGQVAVNRYGEVATGWGEDFLQWFVVEILLPNPGGSETTFELAPPLTLNSAVIDPNALFLGGFSTALRDTGSEVVMDFSHLNSSLDFAGGNPYELKVSVEEPAVGDRTLHVTYGSSLRGETVRIVLFFSHEFSSGNEVT